MAKVKLIKKNPCPFCDRAVALLEEKGADLEIVDLSDKPQELMKLKQETGWMTVPIIFIDNNLIGGYDDLRDLEREGKLDSLLGSE